MERVSGRQVAPQTGELPKTAALVGKADFIHLHSGPLEMVLESHSGFLRHICFGHTEVLRGIYGAVRDRNWNTLATSVHQLRLDQAADRFTVSFELACGPGRQTGLDRACGVARVDENDPDVLFTWLGEISGTPDGTVTYRFDGRAEASFLRNRIGLCVLHPIHECVGEPCTVEHTDDRTVEGHFPKVVAPHQPFKEVRSILHRVAPGVVARVTFEGDTFEMEDQRNWTDASFKTYCTPLELPFPVEVNAGEEVHQRVTLRLEPTGTTTEIQRDAVGFSAPRRTGDHSRWTSQEAYPIRIGHATALPKLGLGMASHATPLSECEVQRLRRLRLSHLRVDLTAAEGDFDETLQRALTESAALGTLLEVALHLGKPLAEELDRVTESFGEKADSVARWLVYDREASVTSPSVYAHSKEALNRIAPGIPVAAGSDANFAEFNRSRLVPGTVDMVYFSTNPQVHATDELSIVETLESIPDLLRTAAGISGNAPAAVSPITLKPRFNAVATGDETPLLRGELPPPVDSRQCALFTAAWTLGLIAQLASAAAHSATFFETTGWRGVMNTVDGTPGFPAKPGTVFPVYHVFADLGESSLQYCCPIEGPSCGRYSPQVRVPVCGLYFRDRNCTTLLVSNLTSGTVRVDLNSMPRFERSWLLDPESVDCAMADPTSCRDQYRIHNDAELILSPYGYAKLQRDG